MTVNCLSELSVTGSGGCSCPFSFCGKLLGHRGWSQSFAFPVGFLGPPSICSTLYYKLCAGSSTLSSLHGPNVRRWPWVQASESCPQRVGKLSARVQKKKFFYLKNCFCRAAFSDVQSTFLVNLCLVAALGRVETWLGYLPQTTDQKNSGGSKIDANKEKSTVLSLCWAMHSSCFFER
jgi:hypothetical protein